MTVYDSLHFLLDHELLPFYYDERRIPVYGTDLNDVCLSKAH
jgi:hypothetical protein